MAIRHRHFPRNRIPLSETFEAWILFASIALSVWLIKSNALPPLIAHVSQFDVVGSFVEGFFFTSILTTIPAIIAILESARYVPAWELALIGGFGAVCGDLLVFRFVRSKLVEHILGAALHPRLVRLGKAITVSPLWWLGPVFGALVIASPLPDEIGLIMMGLSHIRLWQFVPIAFIANATGIFLMSLVAQGLS
ncbi:hypothetical protein A2851_04765 [Candidatus Kaiserbacteria bacterium RIFCSPHIGHO2_01_FULL_53_29]|uniref:Uncharacterized protein n=1 Tax=Candidatus Kaiserbacteria bacterium RIFCSPHIGHO2_01_FULL_53_29 TaxID=1798480 RepID=A0A1F6CTA0_9BACT|nr:MAG: hypothetical protein A2851_04765 [Candidatus Kaiserbacteria bacterium RIFCSPHIGHO2_01_FULL_53_29]